MDIILWDMLVSDKMRKGALSMVWLVADVWVVFTRPFHMDE